LVKTAAISKQSVGAPLATGAFTIAVNSPTTTTTQVIEFMPRFIVLAVQANKSIDMDVLAAGFAGLWPVGHFQP
jgi:hypothetical protein